MGIPGQCAQLYIFFCEDGRCMTKVGIMSVNLDWVMLCPASLPFYIIPLSVTIGDVDVMYLLPSTFDCGTPSIHPSKSTPTKTDEAVLGVKVSQIHRVRDVAGVSLNHSRRRNADGARNHLQHLCITNHYKRSPVTRIFTNLSTSNRETYHPQLLALKHASGHAC